MFTNIVVSVVLEVGKGCANLPTASNSFLLLYIPTVVTKGEKNDEVT
jgi:hypothetical protein